MAHGRVYTRVVSAGYVSDGRRIRKTRAYRLMVAEVRDSDGRIVWTDNTRFSVKSHARMTRYTIAVVDAVRFLESLGHRLEWDWQGCVERAPRL